MPGIWSATTDAADGDAAAERLVPDMELMELMEPPEEAVAASFGDEEEQPPVSSAAATTAAATVVPDLMVTLPAPIRPLVGPGVPTRSP
jgi:hypothetical protein